MFREDIKELKDRANCYFNDEVGSFMYPDKDTMKITFESSEYAEQFINENKNLKVRNELVFGNIKFEQDNDSVYIIKRKG
jgi:hypothetical protein